MYKIRWFYKNSEGECPVFQVHCMIACLPETAQEQCQNDPLCCTKDSQCPRYQKCCQPACGCHHQCLNATNINN